MNETDLDNPPGIALVTGSSRGIGRAIAAALAFHKWNIVVNYRTGAEPARQTLKQVEAMGAKGIIIQADIAIAADRLRLVAAALASFSRIDLLVNNAGMGPQKRVDILEMEETSYDEVMAANLKGPFFLTQQVARVMLEQMKAENAGRWPLPRIINIGSVSAYTSSLNRAEYCISKAGMAMVTSLFADRLSASGINVFEIRPGIIHTDMTRPVQGKYDQLIEQGRIPLQRWGEPEDVARAVVAIAEGYLPYSTGEIINVDGGFHITRL
jgi:3-oxoacyl-[acyl-carrier protein] reductase